MKKYYVVTPAYETYYGEWEPPEYGSDVVLVEAKTKREAKVLGVRELRRTKSRWLRDCEGSPFTGLKVYGEDEDG